MSSNMEIEGARDIAGYWLDINDIYPPEEIPFIPIDWIKYPLETIYKSIKVVAADVKKEEIILPLALDLARVSSNLDVFHANYAFTAKERSYFDQVKVGFDSQDNSGEGSAAMKRTGARSDTVRSIQKQILLEVESAKQSLEASISNNWNASFSGIQNSQRLGFALHNFNFDYDIRHVEHNVQTLGACFAECGVHFPEFRLPAPREELLFCLAMFYVLGTERTKKDYEEFNQGAGLLASVVFDDEAMIGQRWTKPRDNNSETHIDRLYSCVSDRHLYAFGFYHSGFENHCERISNHYDIELPKHSSGQS